MPITVKKITITQVIEPELHVKNLKTLDKFRGELIKQAQIGDAAVDVLFTLQTEDFDIVKYPSNKKKV